MTTMAVKKPARTGQRKAQRVQQIIDCAEEVFDECGFEKATVAEVARRAGVVEGTVFRYFETKVDLVLEITTRWYNALFEELEEGLRGITGTRNRLRYIIWSQLTAAADRAELAGAIIQAARGYDQRFSREVSALYARYTRPLFDTLEQAAERGEIRPGVSHLLVANMLYGGIEQCFWQMQENGNGMDIEKVADDLSELILAGIACSPKAGKDPRADALLDRLEHILDSQAPG